MNMSMANLKDFNMYYKKEGTGEPLILLHGNNEDSRIFDKTIKKLSKRYTVYALDSRGHGKSEGFVGAFSYELMAEDVKEFMEIKKIKNAMVYGFSDGGIIALYLTLAYPSKVTKLMISGVNLFPKGLKRRYLMYFSFKEKFCKSKKEKALYQLMLTQPNLTFEQLNAIKVPTLITVGKKDIVKLKHTLAIQKNISNSQLVLVKNANHYNYICHSSTIATILYNFLTNQKQS